MKLIERDAFLVVGLKVNVKAHELFVKMPKAYEKFYTLIDKIQNRVDDYTMDICLKKQKDNYTQLIGVAVSELHPIPDDLVGMKIDKAKYLYHVHQGNVEGIYQALVDMYDYALNHQLLLDGDEFKIEIHDNEHSQYHLYIKLQ